MLDTANQQTFKTVTNTKSARVKPLELEQSKNSEIILKTSNHST